LQKQAERETAVNRLATAIRNSLDLESVLQTAANEVGRALNVHSCAVRVDEPLAGRQMTKCYLRTDVAAAGEEAFLKDVDLISSRLASSPEPFVVEGDASKSPPVLADAAVPLTHQGNVIGLLLVRSDDLSHGWAENELLLLHTAADQLAVAVQQAEMYEQIREQALTDSLTGCYNRRSLELRLDHNIQMAIRTREPLSVLMLDLDNFKKINDQAGHDTGDVALCMLADTLRGGLRAVDTAARFGGDEFVIILPQANTEGAMVVAERLRRRIAQIQVPGFGRMTSSFGIATFPNHASSKATLMLAADRALYDAKYSGRNRVNIVDTATLGKIGPSIELVDAMQRL
jgi:diguanylate cyclase (GGDEF)-like protein